MDVMVKQQKDKCKNPFKYSFKPCYILPKIQTTFLGHPTAVENLR